MVLPKKKCKTYLDSFDGLLGLEIVDRLHRVVGPFAHQVGRLPVLFPEIGRVMVLGAELLQLAAGARVRCDGVLYGGLYFSGYFRWTAVGQWFGGLLQLLDEGLARHQVPGYALEMLFVNMSGYVVVNISLLSKQLLNLEKLARVHFV